MKAVNSSFRVHCIVEYVKQQCGFPFDVLDVSEDLDAILFFFGFSVELDRYERWLLKQEFEKLAEEAELGEASRCFSRDELELWL
ncbi:MAG: hypothetical protein DRO96_01090 [Candidatus Aenigmatarchaeota archaeon]|nr:MAG: hypothetical protein DRO96_01090 [Candidatus Aenigmarchaeota archaeon]